MASSPGRHRAPGLDLVVSLRQAVRLACRAVSGALVGLTALLMVAIAVGTFVFHIGISPVLTGSMRGTFDPGAVVITRPVPVATVAAGDVLVFQPPGHQESYAHRVVSLTQDGSAQVITTKGDANPAEDPWKAVLSEPTAQQVVFSVPRVGSALVALQQQDVRPFLLAFAGLVFTVMGVRAVLGSSHSSSSHRRSTPSYAG